MKVLTSPSSFGNDGSKPFDILRENKFEIINNPFGRKLTETEVIQLAIDCVGIVAGIEALNESVMKSLPNLKCISRVGVGMDNVDLEYAKKAGISVLNTPDGPTRAVAELTIALTLSLLRKIPQADANMKQKVWRKETGNLLFQKKIGIIGLGRIGKMVAEMFKSLGNPVCGFDTFPDKAWAAEKKVELMTLDSLLGGSDIITLHIPGQKDKTPVIKSREIDLMQEGAFLINIARGGVVDENALYTALKSKKLKGAAIDVFSDEPYKGPLCELDNVILTPHLGSYATESKLQMEIDAVNNLVQTIKRKNEI